MNYWTRNDYETYLAHLGGGDDPGFAEAMLGPYPKNTAAAVTELRSRGLAVTYAQIRTWAQSVGVKSDLSWSAAQIDAAAADLAAAGKLTPDGQMCSVLNVDFHQYQTALLDAGREIDGMAGPGDPTAYAMHIRPGCPGRGICGVATFTAPDEEGKQ